MTVSTLAHTHPNTPQTSSGRVLNIRSTSEGWGINHKLRKTLPSADSKLRGRGWKLLQWEKRRPIAQPRPYQARGCPVRGVTAGPVPKPREQLPAPQVARMTYKYRINNSSGERAEGADFSPGCMGGRKAWVWREGTWAKKGKKLDGRPHAGCYIFYVT